MTKLPENLGFKFRSVYCYQDARSDPWTFYYIPAEPSPELNQLGKPTINMLVSDRAAILQLQTRWDTDSKLLESLKKELTRRYRELDSDLISLKLAPVSSPRVTLAIADGQDNIQDLETKPSSGLSPYSTIFNLRLTAEDKATVLCAFNGNKNYFTVRYDVSLGVGASSQSTIEGDVAPDIKILTQTELEDDDSSSSPWRVPWRRNKNNDEQQKPTITLEQCLAQIETALEEKRLTLSRQDINDVSDQLRETVDGDAKKNAANQLLTMVSKVTGKNSVPDQAILKATAKQTETKQYSFERHSDVSSWFRDGNGSDYVQVSPTPIEEPQQDPSMPPIEKPNPKDSEVTEKVVRLGFEGNNAPISSIEVTCGEAKAILRRSKFQPVTLPFTGESLVVETKYTKAGKTFRLELPPDSEEWLLMPEHLGLGIVVVDGSRPKAEDARKAKITLRYHPSGDGTKNNNVINFKQSDDEWIEIWYLITRSPELDGVIEWFWQETSARGAIVKHPLVQTNNLQLKL